MAASSRQREEQAARELGHTEIGPGLTRAVVIAFLATILLVPAVQLATRPPDPRPLLEAFPTRCSLRTFEHGIEDESTLGSWLLPRLQAFLTAALGVGNEQVVIGRDGWLDHRPGIQYVTGPGFLDPDVLEKRRLGGGACEGAPQPDPIAAITGFQADLAGRGIRLVVVPIPEKAVVAPGHLVPDARGPLQNPSFAAFIAALEAQDVDVLDTTPLLLDGDWFLETDTHWRPRASERVARALADRLLAEGVLAPAPAVSYTHALLTARHQGDLAMLLNLPPGQERYRPEEVTIHQVREDGRPWRPTRGAEVLVLGDSFVNIYSDPAAFPSRSGPDGGWGEAAGLAEQLSFDLGRPVDRIARNGGADHVVRAELAREVAREAEAGHDRLAGVRVVVWEFAMRDLSEGDWKEIPIPGATARPTGDVAQADVATAAPAGASTVLGTLVASARPPRPGSIPYPDALVALHVQGVRTLSGAPVPGDVLVYAFGLRDDAWTPVARLTPGRALRLRVEPWESDAVQSRFGSLNRVELDDVDLLSLPAFFGELEVPR